MNESAPPPGAPPQGAPPPGQTRNAPGQAASQPGTQPTGQVPVSPPERVAGEKPAWNSASQNAQSWEPAKNGAIVPVLSEGGDRSLGFDWQPVAIETNRSCSCVVTAGEGDHALSVRVEQPPYDRTLRGVGSVNVAAIPVAPMGARGRLIARDEVSGATAEFTWEWRPSGKAKWVSPSRAAVKTPAPAPAPAAASAKQESGAASPSRAKANARVNTDAAMKTAAGQASKATFFGVPAVAHRFAFILDMSGSMAGRRWSRCVQQLAGAFEGLSEETEIFVVLFSDRLVVPGKQAEWMRATAETKASLLDWVSRVVPGGGTLPQPAFDLVFASPVRAEVIYFLTDGEFLEPSPSRLKKQCAGEGTGVLSTLGHLILKKDQGDGPPPTVIHTVTLDDASGAGICKKIADETGGQYVHVSS